MLLLGAGSIGGIGTAVLDALQDGPRRGA
jgi:hypothetical protein